jgi:hypothetical protein
MTIQPSSPSDLRLHRQQQERQALDNYTAALRKWERARDRVDELAWELQLVSAELHHKTLGGCSDEELAALRQLRQELQDKHREYQNDSRRAKEEASRRFTALVAARNARRQTEECLEEVPSGDYATIVSLAGNPFASPAEAQWN